MANSSMVVVSPLLTPYLWRVTTSHVCAVLSDSNLNVYLLARAVLYVQPEWDMDALLNAVSNRLEIVPSARRLFNSDGTLCERPPV